MSATGLEVLTLDFQDTTTSSATLNFEELSKNISYAFNERNKIRTLSTTASSPGADIDGLLYTPTLPDGICEMASQYIPTNATRASNLPSKTDIHFIALAPWLNPNCTLEYLQSVSSQNVYAFIFYLPDNGTDIPPLANNAVWSLKDGGKWKGANRFPVYAIPGQSGYALMQQLAIYSGNVTGVPNGHELANIYSPSDYIRLAAEITTTGGNRIPSLWIFLLIVVGIVLFILGSTSFSMQCVQRRRRNRLRRRIQTGDVDLEALGIKKLKVPRCVVDSLPTYSYTPPSKEMEVTPPARAHIASPISDTFSQAPSDTLTGSHTTQFLQPTCAICLDDFISDDSTVRELPCCHFFHSECVDHFLMNHSSLCPICKRTVLPKGYCPANITNAMVQRERNIRRLRDRVPALGIVSPPAPQSIPRARDAMRTVLAGGRRVFSAPVRSGTGRPIAVEMIQPAANTAHPPRPTTADGSIPSALPSEPSLQAEHRREMARQRAADLVETQQAALDSAIEAEIARRPRWRKAVGRIWPGLA